MAKPIILAHQPAWGDPWSHPEYYAGITGKRVIAYLIDLVVVSTLMVLAWAGLAVLGLFTFGLAWHLLWLPGTLGPLAYHSLLIAGRRSATLGMRAMGIRVLSLAPAPLRQGPQLQGGRPTLFQAIILTVAFFASVLATGSLILLVALFNTRRRTMHDWLAQVVVVNNVADGGGGMPPNG